jgi:membrane fusion protein (multidrug efflux system)
MSTQTEEMPTEQMPTEQMPTERIKEQQQHRDRTHDANSPADLGKKRGRTFTIALVALVALAGCIGWFLYASTYESTDDAQVDAHLNPIAARVQGTVTTVYVEDNQLVQAGQPLVDLDPSDSKVALAQAQANYDQAVAQLNAQNPNVPITQATNVSDIASQQAEVENAEAALSAANSDYQSAIAKLRQAEATNQKSQSDLVRYKELLDKQEIANSDYDQYLSTARSQEAAVNAAEASADSYKKVIQQREAQLVQQRAKYRQTITNAPRQVEIKHADVAGNAAAVESAKAQLDQAQLNLAYCHVVAPVAGIVLQRSAEVGQRIAAGTQLLMVAQVDSPWVTANFKETQLRKMHPGQRVTVKVDALDRSFIGAVESTAASTGDRASVLPAENATGNYVKVVQRLPVRIRLKPDQDGLDKVRPGMSVEPTVHFN